MMRSASFENVLELQPDFIDAHYTMGIALVQPKKYPEALNVLDHAIEIDPVNIPVIFLRGKTLLHLGNCSDAIEAFDRILGYAHRTPRRCMKKEGHCYASSGFRKRLTTFGEALEHIPSRSGLWLKKGIALAALDRHDEAMTAFDQALALNPAFTEAMVRKSIELIKLRLYEDAVRILTRSVDERSSQSVVMVLPWYRTVGS